jgi:hypothetical protein
LNARAGVDDWYANVLMIERRKCLLLVHAETLFAVLDTDVRMKQFNDLGLYVGRSSLTRGAMIRTCGWSSAGPLTHRPPCPPPSRVPSPGYAYPQPLTRVTIVI